MRWPWQREPVKPVKDEVVEARIEELDSRHRKALKRAVAVVLSVASDDVEKLIVDDFARADREMRRRG